MRWCLLAGLVQVNAQVAAVQCSDMDRFVRWMEEFMKSCQTSQEMAWFESCAWVTCPCLQRALLVPVPNEEIEPCLTQGMELSPPVVTLEHEEFLYAMMRVCWARTEDLAQPCGPCDMYRIERDECNLGEEEPPDPTLPPTLPPRNSHSAALLGALALLFMHG